MWVTVALVVVGVCTMTFLTSEHSGLGIWLGVILIVLAARRHMTKARRAASDKFALEEARKTTDERYERELAEWSEHIGERGLGR